MSLETDIADALDTAVVALTKGTNLFIGPRRGASDFIPREVVFVLQTGGSQSRPIKTPVEEKRTQVQITVRSDLDTNTGAYQAGAQLANDCFQALQYNPPAGYCEWSFVSSSPLYLGQDDDGAHLWSMNLVAIYDV